MWAFESLIGTMVDIWGADKGLSDTEILTILKDVAKVQESVYEEIGRFDA